MTEQRAKILVKKVMLKEQKKKKSKQKDYKHV